MRTTCRTWIVVGLVGLAAAFAGTRLVSADDDDAESAEAKKQATEALEKSVKRGDELFHSKEGLKKSCAQCHDNADKPELKFGQGNMTLDYPKYSRKRRAVVSMAQKINEMLTTKSGGTKALDLDGADIVAMEAYVQSLKKR
jgi:cytochrome c